MVDEVRGGKFFSAGVSLAIKLAIALTVYGAAVNTAAAWGAGRIGQAYAHGGLDYLTHKAAHAVLGAASGALTASVFGGDKAQAAMGGAIGGVVAEAFVELKSDLLGEAIALKAKNPGLSDADLQKEMRAKFAFDQRLARLAGSAVAVGADALSADASAHNAVSNNAAVAIPYIASFLGASEGVAAIAALGLTGAAITAEAIKKSLPTIAKLYDDYLRGRGVAARETTGGAAPAKRGAANAPTSAAAAPGGMPEPDDGDGDRSWQQKKQLTQKQKEQLEGIKLRGNNPGNVHEKDGILKVDTEMRGDLSKAREVFEKLSGQKIPETFTDGRLSTHLDNGMRVELRSMGASGHPKIEITDSTRKLLEKITFK